MKKTYFKPLLIGIGSCLVLGMAGLLLFAPKYNRAIEKDLLLVTYENLEYEIHVQRDFNQKIIEGIKANVEKNGNREEERELLAKAEKLKHHSSTLIQRLDKYIADYGKDKKEFEQYSWFIYFSVGAKDWQMFREDWEEIRKLANDSLTNEKILIDAERKPLKNGEIDRYYFYAPYPMPYLNLVRLKREIAECENRGLQKLSTELTQNLKWKRNYELVFNPKSNVVYEGERLKGKLWLLETNKDLNYLSNYLRTSVGALTPLENGKMLLTIPKETDWKSVTLTIDEPHFKELFPYSNNVTYSPVIIKPKKP